MKECMSVTFNYAAGPYHAIFCMLLGGAYAVKLPNIYDFSGFSEFISEDGIFYECKELGDKFVVRRGWKRVTYYDAYTHEWFDIETTLDDMPKDAA